MKKIVRILVFSLMLTFVPGYGGILAKKVEGLRYRDARAIAYSSVSQENHQEYECYQGCAHELETANCCSQPGQNCSTEIISPKGLQELRTYYRNSMANAENISELVTETGYSITGTKDKNTFKVSIEEKRVDGRDYRVVTVSVVPKSSS